MRKAWVIVMDYSNELNHQDSELLAFLIILIIFSVIVTIYSRKLFVRNRCENDKILITEFVIADKLKPAACINIAKCTAFIGLSLSMGSFVIPGLLGMQVIRGLGLFHIAVSVIFFLIARNYLKRISKKSYLLYEDKCINRFTKHEVIDGTEIKTEYSYFEILGAISHYHGSIGKEYYILKNQDGKLCQIFSQKEYQLSIDDLDLNNGKKEADKIFLREMSTIGLSSIIFTGISCILLFIGDVLTK